MQPATASRRHRDGTADESQRPGPRCPAHATRAGKRETTRFVPGPPRSVPQTRYLLQERGRQSGEANFEISADPAPRNRGSDRQGTVDFGSSFRQDDQSG
jgi:hypothetical protein